MRSLYLPMSSLHCSMLVGLSTLAKKASCLLRRLSTARPSFSSCMYWISCFSLSSALFQIWCNSSHSGKKMSPNKKYKSLQNFVCRRTHRSPFSASYSCSEGSKIKIMETLQNRRTSLRTLNLLNKHLERFQTLVFIFVYYMQLYLRERCHNWILHMRRQ